MMRSLAALAALAVPLAGTPLTAQMPRIAPPPACRVSAAAERTLATISPLGARNRGPSSVAVFPFELATDDLSKMHIAWAVTERVGARLEQQRRIHVLRRGSVSRASVAADGITDSVVALLHARYLLTGHVESSGPNQLITSELYDVSKRDTVWHASYGSGWSLARAADAIASGVGKALGITGSAGEVSGWPRGDEAFEAMGAGDFAMLSPTAAGADSAVRAYERAFQLEQGAAAIATRLARAYLALLERGGGNPDLSRAETITRIQELASQALRRDSKSSSAWTVRAMAARLADPVSFKGAIAFHQRAIAADRNDADAEYEYGVTLLRLGEDRQARVHLIRALALEPNQASSLAALAAIALRAGDWNEACAFSNASIASWSFDPDPYAVRARARMRLAQTRDAFSDAELAGRLSGGAWSAALRVIVQRGAGGIEASNAGARALTARWLAREQPLGVRDAVYLALMYQAVGDTRRAVESLRRARPVGADLREGIGDPGLAAIRSDTAVVRILRESRSGSGR